MKNFYNLPSEILKDFDEYIIERRLEDNIRNRVHTDHLKTDSDYLAYVEYFVRKVAEHNLLSDPDRYCLEFYRRLKQIEDDIQKSLDFYTVETFYLLLKCSIEWQPVFVDGVKCFYNTETKKICKAKDFSLDTLGVGYIWSLEEESPTESKKAKKNKVLKATEKGLSVLWQGIPMDKIPPFPFRRCFTGINFYPYSPYEQDMNLCSIPDTTVLNRFSAYDLKCADVTEEEQKYFLELIHNLVDVNLCNISDPRDLTHVQELYCLRLWQWIAALVVFPRDAKTKIIIPCFVTGQGAGKGTLYNLIKLIIGCNASPPIDTSQYTSDFNSFMDGKTLVFLDEMRMNQRPYDKLKRETGDKKLAINEKFKPLIEVDSHVHFFIATNEVQSLKCMTEINQRRFLIIRSPYDKYTVPDPSVAVALNTIMDTDNGSLKNPDAEKLKRVFYDHLVQIATNPVILQQRLPHLEESKFTEFRGDLDREIVMKQNIMAQRNNDYVAYLIDALENMEESCFDVSYTVKVVKGKKTLISDVTVAETNDFWNINHFGGQFLNSLTAGQYSCGSEVKEMFFKKSFVERLGLETESYEKGTIKKIIVPTKNQILINLKLN